MIILYMILHISCITLRVFRFCGQGVWYPRKRRKSETTDEVRSLIIVVRGSQTSLRKEEWWHRRKSRKCGKVGHHRGLRSSHTEEGESHTQGRASLASQRYNGFGHLRGKEARKEGVITEVRGNLPQRGRRECCTEVRASWHQKEEESVITEEGREGSEHRGVTELDITEVRGNVVSCRKEGVCYQRLRRESGITEKGRNHHRDKREADITEERNKKYRKKQEIFTNGEWSLILKVRGRLVSQRGRSLASQRLEEVSHHGGRRTLSFMLLLLLGAMILI